jgi:fatty-acyl-CoA synthase
MKVPKAIEMIEREKVTVLMGVPAQYSRMLDDPSYKKRDTSTLRTIVSFGSAVPAELVKRVREEMCAFNLWYGTTEAGYCTTKWGLPLKTLQETVGNPQRGAEWKVVDIKGNLLPRGIEGELCINGPVRSAGYYKDDELNKASFDDEGWFHTGDLGFIDEDGNVHVTGRIKDLVIRGGENILPIEIENEIYEHPSVKDVSIIGMPDPELGERVCAYVVCQPDASLTLEEIRDFLAKRDLAYFKLPERLEIIDSFPRTDSGKIQKFELKKDIEKKLQEKK